MLSKRYMSSTKNLSAIFKKIADGTAPSKFTVAHLKGIGFKSSNDQAVIPILKDLGFLTADGTPTARYHVYRDPSRSRAVMAESLRQAYEELFHITEKPTPSDRKAIEGKFKSAHNVSDRVAELQAMTFLALLSLADLSAPTTALQGKKVEPESERSPNIKKDEESPPVRISGLHYNVQIHLPATKDVEVFNAIFKSLKEHLLGK